MVNILMLMKSCTKSNYSLNGICAVRKNLNCCKNYDVRRVIKMRASSSSKPHARTFCKKMV